MYYLNSRFYLPETHRFINADGLLGIKGNILGHNMYAYTQNNPVMLIDSTEYRIGFDMNNDLSNANINDFSTPVSWKSHLD